MKKGKHIDLKYHFVKECAANEIIINPQDIESEKTSADEFTKPLIKAKVERFCISVCIKPWS